MINEYMKDPFNIEDYLMNNKNTILDFLHSFGISKKADTLLLNVIDKYDEITLYDFLHKYLVDYRSVYISIPGLVVFKVPRSTLPMELKEILPFNKCGLLLDKEFAYIYGNFEEQSKTTLLNTLSYLKNKYEILNKLPFPGPDFIIKRNISSEQIILSDLKFPTKVIVDIIYSLETNIQVLKNITMNLLNVNLNFDVETNTIKNEMSINQIVKEEIPVENVNTKSFDINDHFQYIRIDPEEMNNENDLDKSNSKEQNVSEDNLTWDDYIDKCNALDESIEDKKLDNTLSVTNINENVNVENTEIKNDAGNEIECKEFDNEQKWYRKYKQSPYYDENIEDYNSWIYYAHGVKIPVDLDFDVLTSIINNIPDDNSEKDYTVTEKINEVSNEINGITEVNDEVNKVSEDKDILDVSVNPLITNIENHENGDNIGFTENVSNLCKEQEKTLDLSVKSSSDIPVKGHELTNKPGMLSEEKLKELKSEDFEAYANWMWLLYGITIPAP